MTVPDGGSIVIHSGTESVIDAEEVPERSTLVWLLEVS